jgi:ubiquinone/menaquinone biosynthesis C-methylase UbiE
MLFFSHYLVKICYTAVDHQDASFNSVIDKATLDSLMTCDEDDQHQATTMLQEVKRILCPGGHYVCISHGAPDDRRVLLDQCNEKSVIECLRNSSACSTNSMCENEDALASELHLEARTPLCRGNFCLAHFEEISKGSAAKFYVYVLKRT